MPLVELDSKCTMFHGHSVVGFCDIIQLFEMSMTTTDLELLTARAETLRTSLFFQSFSHFGSTARAPSNIEGRRLPC